MMFHMEKVQHWLQGPELLSTIEEVYLYEWPDFEKVQLTRTLKLESSETANYMQMSLFFKKKFFSFFVIGSACAGGRAGTALALGIEPLFKLA